MVRYPISRHTVNECVPKMDSSRSPLADAARPKFEKTELTNRPCHLRLIIPNRYFITRLDPLSPRFFFFKRSAIMHKKQFVFKLFRSHANNSQGLVKWKKIDLRNVVQYHCPKRDPDSHESAGGSNHF